MLRHVVLYTLKPEALGASADENARLMKEKLEALVGVVPSIRRMSVHRNLHADGPAVILDSDFDDEAGLKAYQAHPAHLSVREFVHAVIAGRTPADWLTD